MTTLKEALRSRLNKKELLFLPRAFDIIGNIAILDIPSGLKKKEKIIAESLLKLQKNIKTVLKKAGKVSGRLRKRKLVWIAGEKIKETVHVESGCKFKLDVENCYFSPRLGADRLEISKQVKQGEKVLVMFGGIAPYAIVIAKNSKPKIVYSIELSRTASRYATENVRLNKSSNVVIIQGDVKKILPKLKGKLKFDRIIMARPQLKENFLLDALKVAHEGSIIHFYDFLKEEKMPDAALEKISQAVETISKKSGVRIESYKLIKWKKVREIGPYKWYVRIDFFVF